MKKARGPTTIEEHERELARAIFHGLGVGRIVHPRNTGTQPLNAGELRAVLRANERKLALMSIGAKSSAAGVHGAKGGRPAKKRSAA